MLWGLLWSLLWVQGTPAHRAAATPLEPGRPIERTLGEGEVHVFSLTTEPAGGRRLVVVQRGVDMVVVALDAAGEVVSELNGPLGRFDREIFLLRSAAASLEIHPRRGGVAAGSYRLSIEVPDSADRLRIQAEERLTAASAPVLDNDAMRRSADLHQAAAADFADLGDRHGESRALLASAVLLRRVGEWERAFELYSQAQERWHALAGPGRAEEVKGFEAMALEGLGLTAQRLGQPDRAQAALEEALALWQELGRDPEQASTLGNLGLLAHLRGDFPVALERYREALDGQRRADNQGEVATLLLNIGSVHSQLGEAAAALDDERRSLELFRRLGDLRGEVDALNNLAVLHRRMGEPEESLRLYDRVRELAKRLGDRASEARALNNQGSVYAVLGQSDRAASFLERALILRRELADLRGEQVTLTGLGEVEQRRGDQVAARRYLEEALLVSRRLGSSRDEIRILGNLGLVLARLGDPAAGSCFNRARELLGNREDPLAEASLLQRQGEASLAASEPERALPPLERALALWRQVGNETGQVLALTALGHGERLAGRLPQARRYLAGALQLIESLRTELANPDLRATFVSSRRAAHLLLVDVLMQLHAAQPGAGYDREALEVSELARGRRLGDLLAEAGVELWRAIPGDLAEHRRDLVRRLSLLTRRQQLISTGALRPGAREDLGGVIADLCTELDLVDSEIHGMGPRGAALAPAKPPTVDQMQALLDHETALLHYALGEERSYLWVVTSEGVHSRVLPPRGGIEAVARRVHQEMGVLITDRQRGEDSASHTLAEQILDPAWPLLDGIGVRRLAVLPDGALHYVPFAALPLPGGGLVVDRFELVRLPSAAVLSALRSGGGAPPAEPRLAILADPVFSLDDPRLGG